MLNSISDSITIKPINLGIKCQISTLLHNKENRNKNSIIMELYYVKGL